MQRFRFKSFQKLYYHTARQKRLAIKKWICQCEQSGNYVCESEYCGTCAKSRLKQKITLSNPKNPQWKKLMKLYQEMLSSSSSSF